MQIKVTSIGAPYAKKNWQEREVQYSGQQGAKKKVLKSFESDGQIWEDFKTIQVGDTVDVKVVKEGEYWNWKSAGKVEANDVKAEAVAPSTPAAPGVAKKQGDWETSEERAKKQVYIVRQSSIDYSLKYWTLRGEQPTLDQVLEVAATFERHVFDKDVASEQPIGEQKRKPGRPKAASPATEGIQ